MRVGAAAIVAGAVALGLSIVFGGCGMVLPNGEACLPGDYVYCACDDSIQGYSECTNDGGGYGPCDCKGGTPPGEVDAAANPCNPDAGLLSFGCPCTSAAQCEPPPNALPGVTADCHDYPAKGGPLCTFNGCTPSNASQVCPISAGGCNMMGQCMVP